MKKAISLFLSLVLCLSLCACGSGNESTRETKATEPATNKLDAYEIEENSEMGEGAVATTESPYANHPHLQYLYGEWEINSGYENDDVAFRSLIVNEDGTCIIDGMSATWTISKHSSESSLMIDIYNGTEMICSASYSERIDSLTGYLGGNDVVLGRVCIGTYTNLSRESVTE